MKTRTKLAALLGAGVLAFGAYGMAFAASVTPTFHDGNITIDGNGGTAAADCDANDALATGNDSGSGTTGNGVTVTWTWHSDTKMFDFSATGGVVLIAYIKGGDGYNEYDYRPDGVTSDTDLVAPENGSGGAAGLSHAVFCTGASEEESQPPSEAPSLSVPPSFTSSENPATDLPSEPNTATIGTTSGGPSDSSWLLVAALGVLLASVVVMTPARAKNRR